MLTQEEAVSVSTHATAAYLWSRFLDEVDDPISGTWVTPLTPELVSLLEKAKDTTPVQYVSGTKITTLSYQYYGTTSMWSIILYLNGYQHPDEIPPGAILNLPSKESIDRILDAASRQTSNYGKVFTI